MVIPPNKYLVIHASEGTDELDFGDGTGHLYMFRTSSMLNNDGDDVLLTDRGFLAIDYVAYEKSTMIDPPPESSAWDGTWYDSDIDEYTGNKANPVADYDNSICRLLNGYDNNSAANWGNASGLEITSGRSNNEIIGLELWSDKLIKYIKTSETAIFNITIFNTGNLLLNLNLTSSTPASGWSAELSDSNLNILPKKNTTVTVTITAPENLTNGNELRINISVTATNYNISQNKTLTTIIPAVDLEVVTFELDGSSTITEIDEGEIIQLKARVNNIGSIDGGAFNVKFYTDKVNPENLLGEKKYEYIYSGYYKYPSVYWDTLGYHGNYTLIVVADADSQIVEPNENNNQLEYQIQIINTTPSVQDKQLLITEVYYDTKTSYEPNEFVRIYNPTSSKINISGWQLADNPGDDFDETLMLPENAWLEQKSGIYITDSAGSFLHELGFKPDFACEPGTLSGVKQLKNPDQWPGLSNTGDLVVLRDSHRHIIDLVAYGSKDAAPWPTQWHGAAVESVPEGKILKRQREQVSSGSSVLRFIDTNSAADWASPRLYGIGQSDFYPIEFDFTGEVIPFISPENSFGTIISELESAEEYIYLNVYEFTHPLLAQPLISALNRGVEVKILLEGNPLGWNFSNKEDPEVKKDEEYTQKYLTTLLHSAGAKIKFMSDIRNDHKNHDIFKRYNYNHAKYAVIDTEKIMLLSGNFKPTSVPADNSFGNREWGIVIANSDVAGYFKTVFESDWKPISEQQNDTHSFDLTSKVYGAPPTFFELNYTNATSWYEPLVSEAASGSAGSISGQFSIEPVLSPDTSARTDSAIIGMIKDAKESVFIQQMDCNLDWILTHTASKKLIFNWSDADNYYLNWAAGNNYHNGYLTAAIDASRRGVDVKILLDSRYVELDTGIGDVYNNSKVDNLDTVQYINKLANLEGLSNNLEARLSYLAGLEKVHNKGVIVDSKKTLVSSINWNYNSIGNNREAGVIIENEQVAEFYNKYFEHDWSQPKSTTPAALPNASEAKILITEFYADTYLSYDADEYITITNPTSEIVDISGWILTDKLTTYSGHEGVLIFPLGTMIRPHQKVTVTRNASAFYLANSVIPDYEFFVDSRSDVPQMEVIDTSTGDYRGLRLANKGDEIVLADEYLFTDLGFEHEHIIDKVVYGNSSYISNFENIIYPFNISHWVGPSIYNITETEVLKRNEVENPNIIANSYPEYIDTNTASDWENHHVYHPGQSDFKFNTVTYTGSVRVFTSPDSSYEAIVKELNNAQKSIILSIYQFHNPYLMDRMINASLRGVDVKIFIDGAPVGGVTDAARYVAQQLANAGCEIRFHRSSTDKDIHRRYRFIHTKYAVIDNFTSIIMSENWKTTGIPVDNTYGNRGWGVLIQNAEIASNYAKVFFHDWNPAMRDSYFFNGSDEKLGAPPEDFIMSWSVPTGNYKPRFERKTINGEFKVTPVIAPDTTLDKYNSILEMINSATESVYIEQLNCYIDWDTKDRDVDNLYLTAAFDAASRGCEVKILLDAAFSWADNPGLDNYDSVSYINSKAKAEGLSDKIQAKLIYLYGASGNNELDKIHNKGVIVDGKKTLISSINWATGSVIYNREAGVIIENEQVADYYTEIFNYDWNLSVLELVEAYVMHSDMRDITPGASTEYEIYFSTTQPIQLWLNVSLIGLKSGWSAQLSEDHVLIPPEAQNTHSIAEAPIIFLTVTAPTQEYLNQLENSSGSTKELGSILKLELGIQGEINDMTADIVYTTTNIINASKPEPDSMDDSGDVTDRSLIDPWLVVILLAVMLIIGAVVRDLIHSRTKKTQKQEKEAEELKKTEPDAKDEVEDDLDDEALEE
jgi:phosphatidylserine/phosphatidylglycerophosphate/cardiolipin synthase-like enzyme